jgi:16S rRNA (adenine1518-N6/adenine1519-N6)-dimethyltransferase
MMQKEAAERIMGEPGSRAYSPIGVIARSQGSMKRVLSVSQGSFYPQPHVDSVVLQWLPAMTPLVSPDHLADFAIFVQACFRQRRKTLANSFAWPETWRRSGWQIIPMETVLERTGLSPSVRAEALQPAQLCELFSTILACQ